MEAMPFRAELGEAATLERQNRSQVVSSDWRAALPVLHAAGVTLRQLRTRDAAPLLAMLTTEEVTRFISPPPTTVEGFERFIAWTLRQQAAGKYVCFGIVPRGHEAAVGLIQVRALESDFSRAEWGFAVGSEFWGTGVFYESAKVVVDFAIRTIGVHRLEARAAVANGRGNGALMKLGAIQEAVLRQSLLCRGQRMDQVLWCILDVDWRREPPRFRMH